MRTSRLAVNLVAFLALSGLVIGWATRDLFGSDLGPVRHVTATFEATAGIGPASDVTYLGQSVGRVDDVALADEAVDVVLAVRADVPLPADVTATIRRRSAVGEPFVDLAPGTDVTGDGASELADGDRIPRDRTAIPLAYARLFEAVSELFAAVEPEDLEVVLGEVATALEGRGDAIHRILRDGAAVGRTALANRDVIDEAITEVAGLASLLERHDTALAGTIDDLETVGVSLQQLQDEYEAVLEDGDTLLAGSADLLPATSASLGCTLTSLTAVATALDPATLDDVEGILERGAAVRDVFRRTISELDDGPYLENQLLFTEEDFDTDRPIGDPPPPPALDECAEAAPATRPGQDADLERNDRVAAPTQPRHLDGVGADAPSAGAGTDPEATSDRGGADDQPPYGLAVVGLLGVAAVALLRPWRVLTSRRRRSTG